MNIFQADKHNLKTEPKLIDFLLQRFFQFLRNFRALLRHDLKTVARTGDLDQFAIRPARAKPVRHPSSFPDNEPDRRFDKRSGRLMVRSDSPSPTSRFFSPSKCGSFQSTGPYRSLSKPIEIWRIVSVSTISSCSIGQGHVT